MEWTDAALLVLARMPIQRFRFDQESLLGSFHESIYLIWWFSSEKLTLLIMPYSIMCLRIRCSAN